MADENAGPSVVGDVPPAPFQLPRSAADVDAAFMTVVLRWRGVLSADQEVAGVAREKLDTADGYQTTLDICKVKCTYGSTGAGEGAPAAFLLKCFPEAPTLPQDALEEQLCKEIAAAQLGADFYARARCFLAAGSAQEQRWALLYEDAELRAEHMVYETGHLQYGFDFVVSAVLPSMVRVALAYEGCHDEVLNPAKAAELKQLPCGRPEIYAQPEYINMLQVQAAPAAELADALLASTTTTADSERHEWGSWDLEVAEDYCETYVRKAGSLWSLTRPDKGASCTLAHGDLRGDSMFHADGAVLCHDFQLMTLAPVPTDLAYFMATASVMPACYERVDEVLQHFYDAFSAKAKVYTPGAGYTFEKFREEFVIMSTRIHLHFLAMGAALFRRGEEDELIYAPELGSGDVLTDDLPPAQVRTRNWTKATYANLQCFAKKYQIYGVLQALPDAQLNKEKTPVAANRRRSSVGGLLIVE